MADGGFNPDPREFGVTLRKATIEAAQEAARAEVGRVDVAKIATDAAAAAVAATATAWQATLAEKASGAAATIEAASEALMKRLEGLDLDKIQLAYAEARLADRRAVAERTEIFAKVDSTARQLVLAEVMAGRLLKAAEQVEELAAALELRLMDVAETAAIAKVEALRGEMRQMIPESAPEQALGIRQFVGPWAEGMTINRGDVTMHKGSAWIANRTTTERPLAKAGGPFELLAGAIGK